MALEVWHNQRPDSDEAAGDAAIVIETPGQLDAFIDQVQVDTRNLAVPSAVEISIKGEPMRGVLYAGLGQERGFVQFLLPEALQTVGDAGREGTAAYDYMRHPHEVPASIEVPIEQVRAILHEFAATGERPETVAWQPAG